MGPDGVREGGRYGRAAWLRGFVAGARVEARPKREPKGFFG
jgi:hypothetical protein